MNKKFFNSMKSFATALLIIGVCGSILILLMLSVIEAPTGSYSFNPVGFAGGIACLFGSIAGYYLLKGVALVGLRAYEDEVIPEVGQIEEEPATPTEDQLKKQKRLAIWFTALPIVLLIIIVVSIIITKL